MLRPRRDTQIILKTREKSPSKFLEVNRRQKRLQIDLAGVERSNVDQALAPIAVAPERNNKSPIPIPRNSLNIRRSMCSIERELLDMPVSPDSSITTQFATIR
jgi:hypothetical protein